MQIIHWSAAALLLAASAALIIRKSNHPLAYALGFWAALILMVTDLAADAAWWWSTADAVVALVFVASMMDVLSDRRVTSAPVPVVSEETETDDE